MQDKIFDIIADYTGTDKSKITLESRLIDDLGADSLSAVEIVIALEKQFGITIPDNQVESMVKVKDVIAIVESKQ
jgi:acyl carrier protein